MRCLVTGASGHLGSYVSRLLLGHGHDVAVIVRQQSNLWRISDVLSQTKLIRGDLATIDHVVSEVMSLSPQIVFHLAWYGVTGEYHNDLNKINYNVIGSLRLLQAAQESGCTCWVGIGSQAEYGRCQGVLRENLPTRPRTTYGITKLHVGRLSRELCEMTGIRYLWLRLLATYGPKDNIQHLIPKVTLELLARKKPAVTHGEQRWDYLYVEDAAEAICQAALNSEAQGVFNLGSGEVHSVRSIVERIRDLIDPSLPLGFGEIPYHRGQIMHLQADITRLQKIIGWSPRFALDEGLRRTVDWYRKNWGNYA